jgi:AcrR family transcriptional regulator
VTDESVLGELVEEVPGRLPGRPRCAVTHQAILDCANSLLEEIGFSSMSIEGIAARAGVGKATIYRRWPNKASVVMDAFLAATSKELPFPDTGSAREDIRRQMRAVVKVLNGPRGRTIATLIGVVQSDNELAEAFRTRFVAVRRSEAKAVLQRGVANGEFKPDMDLESVLDCLYGPLYFRLLIGHEKASAKYADQLVDLVLHR